MKRGRLRDITWARDQGLRGLNVKPQRRPKHRVTTNFSVSLPVEHGPSALASDTGRPQLDPPPSSAEEEAVALLQVAAEVEGSLMVQYLFSASSLLAGVAIAVPGFDHPIQTDDWYDLIRTIAKQEMGHLITVQNLLLSLGASPHVDRENLPLTSPLYPFPFSLQPVRLATVAKYVCAEAPRTVAAGDQADFDEALRDAKIAVGGVTRAGQIYERLYYLFQDDVHPQEPWLTLENPFPDWPKWHVDSGKVGLNQDRQANPTEWRGQGGDEPPDTAIYVLQVQDKPTARQAVYSVALQGEGPVGDAGVTHFEKFMRIYRELRGVLAQPGAPILVRNQADDPRTGLNGTATITEPKTLAWAELANVRYQVLLVDIALSVSLGSTGSAPGTTAMRKDFFSWAFREMLASVKPISEELRQMPLGSGEEEAGLMAGFPFELPQDDLPAEIAGQLQFLRERIDQSAAIRAQIESGFSPTPKQKGILTVIGAIDAAIHLKLG